MMMVRWNQGDPISVKPISRYPFFLCSFNCPIFWITVPWAMDHNMGINSQSACEEFSRPGGIFFDGLLFYFPIPSARKEGLMWLILAKELIAYGNQWILKMNHSNSNWQFCGWTPHWPAWNSRKTTIPICWNPVNSCDAYLWCYLKVGTLESNHFSSLTRHSRTAPR